MVLVITALVLAPRLFDRFTTPSVAYSPRITGRLASSTGGPYVDSYIRANWYGGYYNLGLPFIEFEEINNDYKSEILKADKTGKFTVPSWTHNLRWTLQTSREWPGYLTLFIVAPGYRAERYSGQTSEVSTLIEGLKASTTQNRNVALTVQLTPLSTDEETLNEVLKLRPGSIKTEPNEQEMVFAYTRYLFRKYPNGPETEGLKTVLSSDSIKSGEVLFMCRQVLKRDKEVDVQAVQKWIEVVSAI